MNSYEAESRRLARFSRLARTPGRVLRRPSRAKPRVSLHAGSANAAVSVQLLPPDYSRSRMGISTRCTATTGSSRQPWAEFACGDRSCDPRTWTRRRSVSPVKSTKTASRITSTPPQRACSAHGASTPFRSSSGRRNGRTLPAGLRQRARLLNAVAADLYGPQIAVARGVAPTGTRLPASRVHARLPRRPSAGWCLPPSRRLRPRARRGR